MSAPSRRAASHAPVPAPSGPAEPATARVRIDKWLWAARFFKTRSAAAEAIDGGKVDVNGERAKRARAVQTGETITVRRPPFEQHVVVRGLAELRGPASVAALLYEETAASRQARDTLSYQLKNAPTLTFEGGGRPTKRDRRQIQRIKDRW